MYYIIDGKVDAVEPKSRSVLQTFGEGAFFEVN